MNKVMNILVLFNSGNFLSTTGIKSFSNKTLLPIVCWFFIWFVVWFFGSFFIGWLFGSLVCWLVGCLVR